jgi:hypothetical protein
MNFIKAASEVLNQNAEISTILEQTNTSKLKSDYDLLQTQHEM